MLGVKVLGVRSRHACHRVVDILVIIFYAIKVLRNKNAREASMWRIRYQINYRVSYLNTPVITHLSDLLSYITSLVKYSE